MSEVDRSKLTVEQLAQLEQYHASRKQLETLKDIADMFQEVLGVLSDNKEEESLNNLGTVLVDIRETLAEINGKEAPEVEDKTKDVIASVVQLEKTLSAAIKALKLSPSINVAAPNVKVDAPTIDLRGIEKLLKKDIPTAFEKAIQALPQVEQDDTEMLIKMDAMLEQLASIDLATRLKAAFPNTLIVTNQDGTSISAVNLKQGNTIKFATISVGTIGDNIIVAAVTGAKIKVLSAALVSSGTVSVKWRNDTTDISGAMPLVTNSGFVLPASAPGMGHYFETGVNKALNINLSAGVNVYGHISYYEEA